MLYAFLREIDAVGVRARAHPLRKVMTCPDADLQHLLAMMSCELRERKDLGLNSVPMLLELIVVLTRVLLLRGKLRAAGRLVPVAEYRSL